MAVLQVKEIHRYDWEEDSEGNETARIEYEILLDSYSTTISTILAHASIPDRRDPHPENALALCINRGFKRVDGFDTLVILTATFSTKYDQEDNDDPLNLPIKGGMKSGFREVPAYYDAYGQPLVNDAGDLFEGLTKKSRIRTVNVTTNFSAIPDYLFELADTLNANAVTIHGKTRAAGTCFLSNVNMPDEPTSSKDGVTYWPITYDVEINPSGYHIILPNKGMHELIYETRADAAADFKPATKAAYDAKTPTSDRRIVKERIKDERLQDTAKEIWLDHNGQAVRVISLTNTPFGSGAMTAGSATLTVAGGLVAGTHTGCLVIVPGAGPNGRKLEATITAVGSGTSCTLSAPASTTVSGKSVLIPGARFKYFILEDLADWSSVPLPNNQP
jgi:hypothetical protein